ncbi:MBL fold metallo-hydrolase [Methanolobus sp. WCC4]|uniref:MBL fold metallo-hydrolase n=1 Tax=Methanolobus sp. WCC4 TaxID=3125784 RepID=UPI0030F73161
MVGSTSVIPVPLKMTTAFLVKGEGIILVDSGFPESEDTIIGKLDELDIAPEEVSLIVLTHAHPDHAGSASALRERTGAKVLIHRLDADKLRNGTQGELNSIRFVGRIMKPFFEREKMNKFPPVEPDIIIGSTFDLSDYGIKGEVIHTPGHTPGSVSVILENGDAIVGDLIVPSLLSNKPNFPFWADDRSALKKSIQKVVSYRPERVYIAHFGGPYSSSELKAKFRV